MGRGMTPGVPIPDSDPRPEVRTQAVVTPEAAAIKKSARGVVALLLADIARRKHLQP